MTTTPTDTFRALCAELADALEEWQLGGAPPEDTADADLIARARAALAQPEPVGATDEPLGDLIDKWVQEAFRKRPYGCKHPMHTYVAGKAFEHGRNHAARPAIKPVPVSERLPGPEDCDPHGWCWVLYEGYQTWTLEPPLDGSGPRGWSRPCGWTHWLPHCALPVPNTRSEENYEA